MPRPPRSSSSRSGACTGSASRATAAGSRSPWRTSTQATSSGAQCAPRTSRRLCPTSSRRTWRASTTLRSALCAGGAWGASARARACVARGERVRECADLRAWEHSRTTHAEQYVLAEALKAEHAVAQMSTRAVANVAAGTVFHLPSDPNEDPPAILASSKECPPDGERALRFAIQVRVLKGLPGRQKVHTLELIVPVTSVATKDDAVR